MNRLTLYIILSLYTWNINAQDHILEYKYKKILEINNTTENIYFIYPQYIVTDSVNNIYITDIRRPGIKKFNSKGIFIEQFGRRGRGPGEFTQISTMFINKSKDEIYVIDRFLMRLTKFKTNGDVSEIIEFPDHKMFSPWQGKVSDRGEIYLLYRNYSIDPKVKLNDNIIHVYDSSFSEWILSIGNISSLGNLNNDFEDAIIGGPTTAFFDVRNNTVVLASYFNKGDVIKYKKSDTSWDKTYYDQYTYNEKYYEIYDPIDPPVTARVIGMGDKTLAGIILQSNVGVFFNSDSTFVVFSYQMNQHGRYEFGVNLFDSVNDKYLGYSRIEELNIPEDNEYQTSPIKPAWFDGVKYYFIDIRQDEPKIIVATIKFNLN